MGVVHYASTQGPWRNYNHLSGKESRDGKESGVLPPLPADPIGTQLHWEGTAHQRIDENRARRVLFDQLQKKPLEPDRLNFSKLKLL